MKVLPRPLVKTGATSATPSTSQAAKVETSNAGETAFTASAQRPAVQQRDDQAPASHVKLEAQIGGQLHDGWLKVHEVTVNVSHGGVSETQHLKLLQRPGHDSTHVATLRLHGDGPPSVVYKEGDTRPTAALRGTPYVSTGIVAGSLDHDGVDAEATALMEIAEEVGGQPLGRLVRIGDAMPTMPVTDGSGDVASSESDNYFVGVLSNVQGEIMGDGGGMEVRGLIKPVDLSVGDALKKLDSGGIRENARARVALSRALDKMGFVPQLNVWLRELPPALQQRFDTLGLGELYDPRTATAPAVMPKEDEAPLEPQPTMQNMQLASKIDDVDLGQPAVLDLGNGAAMLSGQLSHLADDGTGQKVPVGAPVPVETLHVDYDRLKLAQYFVDPKLGPFVKLDLAERPILAAKEKLTGRPEQAVRHDVTDVKVPLPHIDIANGRAVGARGLEERAAAAALDIAKGLAPGARIEALSAPSYASPGQSDLQYHFLAASVPPGSGGSFVPLAEALRRSRSAGAGDANTEALLLRLADRLRWISQLGMTVEQAKQAAQRVLRAP